MFMCLLTLDQKENKIKANYKTFLMLLAFCQIAKTNSADADQEHSYQDKQLCQK